MKNLYLILLLCLLACLTGCAGMFKRLPGAPQQYGPYLFISEEKLDEAYGPERKYIPISPREVLLFPVICDRANNEKNVVSLGHPVIYEHMTDVLEVKFRGISGSVTNVDGFIVWAKDYYPSRIANQFMRSATYEGKSYPYQILTPLMPSTDRNKMVAAIFNELRKGEITVDQCFTINADIDYGSIIKTEAMFSWMQRDSKPNVRRPIALWCFNPGTKVRILLDDEDYALMRRYLLDEKDK